MNTVRWTVLRKLFILGLLIAGLGFFTSDMGAKQALAVECCSVCVPNYQNCLVRSCGCDPLTFRCPTGSSGCQSFCQLRLDQCDINCNQDC
jgi:hypothetical protein